MGLTITNTNTISLLNTLTRLTNEQSSTTEKLTTSYRINKGSDDPAGLIAVESLTAELTAVDAAIASGQRADSILGVADSAFGEISSLLSSIQSLAEASTNETGITAAEIAANQSQIDQAISTIDRIVSTTEFNGTKLLDGSQAIRFSRDATATTDITDVRIYARNSDSTSTALSLTVNTAASVTSANVATTASVSAAVLTIQGNLGTATIDVGNGEALSSVQAKIIAAAGQTGVSARVSGTSLKVVTRDYGTDAFVSVNRVSGDADFTNVQYQTGNDAVVTVGGQQVTADGLRVNFNSNGISAEFTLTATGNTASSAGVLTVSDGGATFQLGTDSSQRATIGLSSLASHSLGSNTFGYLNQLKSGGSYSLTSDPNQAVSIVRDAITQAATSRGRVGGFQKFAVQSTLNNLGATKIALTDARGAIRDTDYAAETSNLARQNVLLQSTISLLGVAAQSTSRILSLL